LGLPGAALCDALFEDDAMGMEAGTCAFGSSSSSHSPATEPQGPMGKALLGMMENISLAAVQRLAAASKAENGTVGKLTEELAGLGSKGKFGNNIQRDFTRKFRTQQFYVEPDFVPVPVMHKDGVVRTVAWPVLSPHRMIRMLDRNSLTERFLLGNIDVSSFWSQFGAAPGMQRFAGLSARHLPIRIHGDEGKWLGKERSIMIINWSGIAHAGNTFDDRLLFTVVPALVYYKEKGNNLTLNALFAYLTWSINLTQENSLQPGFVPNTGITSCAPHDAPKFQAELYEGRYALTVIGIKGDWKFEKETFAQKRSYNHALICCWCDADYVTNPFFVSRPEF